MEDNLEITDEHACKWTKGRIILYKYQGAWKIKGFHERIILAEQNFKAQPDDVFLCSFPKTGTTWLKSLAFTIATREKFDASSSPLLTTFPHECVPYLEMDFGLPKHGPRIPLMGTHLPYNYLPKSVLSSDCKMEAFDEFCEGITGSGSYWDHILGYWQASHDNGRKILFLKYEDIKQNTAGSVKRLAEFMGYPFSIVEEKAGVIENIIKLCSFENLSNLEVNKSGSSRPIPSVTIENRSLFRKGKVGDSKHYLTEEMKEKIDKLMDEKLGHTGLLQK
ncbi:hypothetical protein E3N88_11023 [Mikania micrantha]|uniref:Sulfotransferase n=1 Tax=Mikania micrantha TaxID=192012 RepID=A0A5N6PE20_9ASTR|nr:hypothetical protein E3N88_11023 [Mikania micrantha]